MASKDIGAWLAEAQTMITIEPETSLVEQMIDQAAVLDLMAKDNGPPNAVLFLRKLQPGISQPSLSIPFFDILRSSIRTSLEVEFGFSVKGDSDGMPQEPTAPFRWLSVEGPTAESIVQQFTGSYLHVDPSGGFTIYQVGRVPCEMLRPDSIEESVQQLIDSAAEHSATEVQAARQMYIEVGSLVDFPSGISTKNYGWKAAREMTLRSLPLPREILGHSDSNATTTSDLPQDGGNHHG